MNRRMARPVPFTLSTGRHLAALKPNVCEGLRVSMGRNGLREFDDLLIVPNGQNNPIFAAATLILDP
jgi:hypothetical protein